MTQNVAFGDQAVATLRMDLEMGIEKTGSDGVCETPGLYCLGRQWGRRRLSGLVPGASGDAERIAEHIASR